MSYLESSLEVMEHCDLFQWLESTRKTGRCRFRNGSKIRNFYFEDGRIVGCDSNEPHLLLGQFLLSQGRIDGVTLQQCMKLQEASGRTLGQLLRDTGKIASAELERLVTSKAEETIFGLFDWTQGLFRFDPHLKPPDDTMNVDLDVRSVLLEGARRADECKRLRQIFRSPDVILHRTDRRPDPHSIASYMGRKLYESIDGKRTLAEIILVCRTTEFAACTFLSRQVECGVVRLGDVRASEATSVQRGRSVAVLQDLVARGDYLEAVNLISGPDFEGDGTSLVGMLIAKAEAGFLAEAYRTRTPPDAIPRRLVDALPRGDGELTSEELFLLDLIDGRWDVRTLVWIAPMRKVSTIRALQHMLDRYYIELETPGPVARGAKGPVAVEPEDVDEAVETALG